ncbi:MAG: replicative DNA helicase [Oscillospiraceae bacterium]|nr:replicative DNA helicase [Oscillospiraceae bacterium]
MANESFSSQSKIYSFEAEQAVLGSILVEPSSFSVAAANLRSEYFYYPQHKSIFSIMEQLDLANGTVDLLMVLEELRKQKVFSDDASSKQYLVQLTDLVPSAANIENYCKIVKDKFYIRTLVNISNEIIDMAENSGLEADAILDNAEQRIYDIRQGKTEAGPSSLESLIKSVYDHLSKLNSEDKEQYKGLPTGFPDFDNMCTGLNKSDLVIVGARPAMGKTSFALNMARNVAVKTRKKVLFFSLEMSKEQLAQRVISTEARIPSQKMRTGELTPNEWDALYSACVFLTDIPLYFDDTSSITVPEMKSKVRRLKDTGAVFIDYLQLMQSAKRTESRVQEVTEITRSLKLMAKDLMIPVVVCAQLSRSTESRGNKSHKPQLADLRESGSIEQDADIVVMLYREDYYQNGEKTEEDEDNKVNVNLAQLLVEKNRHGPTGSIKLAWNPMFTLYTCIEKNQNDEGQ